jgi:hypothetical protein
MEKLVVTRYKTLVEYLKKKKLIDDNTKILSHAKVEDVMNKHVIGVLPYWLSCHTGKFTEIQLRIPQEKRGQELTLEEIEFYALPHKTYQIREVSFKDGGNKDE